MSPKPAAESAPRLHGLARFGQIVQTPVMGLLSKIHVEGGEHMPQAGPFIVAPNHISEFDPVMLGVALGRYGRAVRFVAKEELFKVPVVGPFMRKWGTIPIVRDPKPGEDALIHARNRLEEGGIVGIYFEGTLTRDPAFWPMKGKTGLARLALDLRVPIIPVVQWGAQDVLGRYAKLRLFRRRPNIFVRVLPALDYSDIEGTSENREGVRELTRRLEDTLIRESGTLRNQVPPRKAWNMADHDGPGKKYLKGFAKWRSQLARAAGKQDILAAAPRFEG